jgi:hypothetical protein
MEYFDKLVIIISQILEDEKLAKQWKEQKKRLEIEVNNLIEIEKEIPEGWVPLRLACSVLLTQQTNLKNVNFPRTIEHWKGIWQEIKPSRSIKPRYAKKY